MKTSQSARILIPMLMTATLVVMQWVPAQAEKHSRTEPIEAVQDTKTKKNFETSARDPVRELRAQIVSLHKRVAELETQVGKLGDQAPADGLDVRIAALENVLAVAPGGDVTLSSSGKVSIEGSIVDLNASNGQTQAATATFSGVVNVQTLHAKSVVAEEMSPAAGNVW